MSSGKKQKSAQDVFIETLEFKFMKGFLICWTVWKVPELAKKKSPILAENIGFFLYFRGLIVNMSF